MNEIAPTSSNPRPWRRRLILAGLGLAQFLMLALAFFRTDWVVPDPGWGAAMLGAASPGYWLSQAHLILPVALLPLILAARRFGFRAVATAAATVWGLGGVIIFVLMRLLGDLLTVSPLPAARTLVAFILAMAIGQGLALWLAAKPGGRASLALAVLAGGAAFAALFHSLAYAGIDAQFAIKALLHTLAYGPSVLIAVLVAPAAVSPPGVPPSSS